MKKLRAFALIVIGVFISSAGPIFLSNALNLWVIPLSTWQVIISAGVFGVVTYLVAVLAPVGIQPSKGLRLPEA